MTHYHIPSSSPFVRTNRQTIAQRATLLQELLPAVQTIGELCCGDCSCQSEVYRQIGISHYVGLDISGEIVATNRARGLNCLQGDVLNPVALRRFIECEILFFGPPLSVNCDGHQRLTFSQVLPDYAGFSRLLWVELAYQGTAIYICPNSTTPADVRQMYDHIRLTRPDVGMRLVWQSWSTETGQGVVTEPRLKYIEVWFSSVLPDRWEFRSAQDSS